MTVLTKTAKLQDHVPNSLADIGQYLSYQMQGRFFYRVSKTEVRIKRHSEQPSKSHSMDTVSNATLFYTLEVADS